MLVHAPFTTDYSRLTTDLYFSRRRLRAEIDLDDARVALGAGGRAIEYFLAVVQHDDAVDHAHQHAHDVLDPDDGDALLLADALQHVGGLIHLAVIEAVEALVGKQQPQTAAKESAMKDQQIQQITQTMQMASNASTKALGDMVSANQEAIRQRQMSAQVKSEMDGLKQHLMELGGQVPPSPPADMAGAPEVGPGMQAQVDQSSPQAQQAQQQAAQAQQAQQAPQQPAQAEGGQPKQGSFKQMVRSMYTRRI